MIYLIGSLRNPEIPRIAWEIRAAGHDVFADWFAAGERADDAWRDWERGQGRSYVDALHGPAATNVFNFDYTWLSRADAVVLALPAGKSGHLELGWALGQRKPGYILLDNPDRWDVMYRFATGVYTSMDQLLAALKGQL